MTNTIGILHTTNKIIIKFAIKVASTLTLRQSAVWHAAGAELSLSGQASICAKVSRTRSLGEEFIGHAKRYRLAFLR